MEELSAARDVAWLWVAGPIVGIVALYLTARLGVPQILRLGAAFRGLREHDRDAAGEVSPGVAVLLSTVGAYGAAGAVGAATAISIGGAGAIAWIWLGGLLVAALRYAETLLARTDAPGRGDAGATGSLPARLARSGGAGAALGLLLAALVVVAGIAFVGGVQGAAVQAAADRLLPQSAPYLLAGVAAVGALLGGTGPKRAGAVAGFLGLAALVVLAGVAGWAALFDPGRALGAIPRALSEAFGDAPAAGPFVGAFAGEIAAAAIVHLLPPLVATSGVDGAVQATARARTTRGQAASAVLAPLVVAVVTTMIGMALVGTGSFFRRVDDAVPFSEVTVYRTVFETASQREEQDRFYTGFLRVRDGEMRDVGPVLATVRGGIESPRFEYYGRPAEVALRIRRGEVVNMLRPGEFGALVQIPIEQRRHLIVRGEMLPGGGTMIASAMTRGTGGDHGARIALAALLALAAAAAGVWGFGLSRAIPRPLPNAARVLLGVLPGAGIGLFASGLVPWLPEVGAIAGAALATVAVLALAFRAGEIALLKR